VFYEKIALAAAWKARERDRSGFRDPLGAGGLAKKQ
jgi:hypothetical protein